MRWSDDVLHGWGVRDNNWDLATRDAARAAQALSMTAGYYFNTGGYFRNTAAPARTA